MSEENSDGNIAIDKDTKKVRVLLDPSPQIAAKDAEIAELNRTVGALLNEHKSEFVPSIEPKKPNANGETALLYEPENKTTMNIEPDSIPIEWIKGKDEATVLQITSDLAKKGNRDCQKALRTLARRSFRDGINLEFRGSSIDFNRSELPLSDDLPIAEQERRRKRNAYLVANRCKWADLNREGDA
jgi:hypothetical protein